ncbi:MAG TPA: HEAT repeat domain-containing protein [Kofleriaceae bacterium]|nr:HEAT repeat domain-containing protein [Kofleriaceae bacterium]
MRCIALVIVLAACGPKGPPPASPSTVPRLLAPPLIDPEVRGAAYLTAVALSLQPAWHQFLEDCRLRLPADHALNHMDLVTTAQLEIGARGELAKLAIAPSGNRDFDKAIEQVVRDAVPLPPPPRELWSDDDRVHLAWTFARDRRQAGPATAQVGDVLLPLRVVVAQRIRQNDLTRAARRIAREPVGAERDAATQRLMIAALDEGARSSDVGVRKAAVQAIATAGVHELDTVAADLVKSADLDLSSAVIEHGFAPTNVLALLFHRELTQAPKRTRLIIAALAVRDHAAAVDLVRRELATTPATDPAMLQALAIAPVPDVADKLVSAFGRGDASQRSGVCGALARYPAAVALPIVTRGLGDRDASVRASCLATLREQATAAKAKPALLTRVRELAKDRDSLVRAQAIAALAAIAPATLPDAVDDRAADVRAAYAGALALVPRSDATTPLVTLADDRDPDVRAAAWTVLAAGSSAQTANLAKHAAKDSAAQVRLAALPAARDEDLLLELANRDDSTDVRTAALVQLARIRTRHAIADLLLARLADAAPGSAERVRTALAWLQAR